MDSELEKHYLNRSLHTDDEISDIREKKYYHYRGKLMDFKELFQKKINDVEFEVIFEKLINSFLDYRIVDLASNHRLFYKAWKPHLDDDGDIKSEFSTERYEDSLKHQDDELMSDEEEQNHRISISNTWCFNDQVKEAPFNQEL